MAVALFFEAPVKADEIKALLMDNEGFKDILQGYRTDHSLGEEPGRVEMALPNNILFHTSYTPEEATEAFRGIMQRMTLSSSQVRYIAFSLASPPDCRGNITKYVRLK